ncbi:hypothetical protein [Streptococcus sp. S784/96/1]|uniref:hypothetical protein n=1 Tax=Streptococcus sp. S784/96/1 TaxID=2653499 RepID=UPI00192EB72A|nr:hypothetical protein [Streptococcus sp. S784/96/1]
MGKNQRKKLVTKKAQSRDLKQETTWKNNLFSRYMLFRYSLTLFFFANIYWGMIQMYRTSVYIILPIGLLLLLIRAIAEQFSLYGKTKAVLIWTKRAFQAQGIVNVLALLSVVFPGQFEYVFPVFASNLLGKLFVSSLLLLGLLAVWHNVNRVQRVETNTDNFYYRFQKSFGKIF